MADDQHEVSRDVAKQESGGPVAPEPEEHTETQGASSRSDDAAASGAAASGAVPGAVSDNATSDNAASENTVPGETAAGNTASETAATGDASPDNTPLAHDGPQQETSGAAPTYAGEKIGLFSGRKNDFSEKYHLTRRGKLKRLDQIIRIANQFDAIHGLTPVKMRLMFEALGPTFVKVGQILSMRSEILPQSFCDELAKLRANADPMPYQTVLDTLSHEYGKPVKDIFKSIDSTPLGSASLAQVHRATLVTGQDVAVKVQRPGVRETMAQDVSIMRTIARSATKIMHNAQVVDFQGVVEELWDTFESETDFLVEARNLQEFKRFCSRFAYMDCPKPYMDLCTEHVVVMDYIDGISLSHPGALVAKGYDLKEIGTKLVDNYATQVLDEGFFHADPHPGNIIISGGKIILIDLGMTGRLNKKTRTVMKDMIFAVAKQDSPALADGLLRFATTGAAVDNYPELLADLDLIVEEYGTVDLDELDIASFITSLTQLAQRHGIEVPSSVTTVGRALVTLEGLLDEFIPDVNMIEIISQHIASSKTNLAEIENEVQTLGIEGHKALHGALQTLAEMKTASRMLTRGQLRANMQLVGFDEPFKLLSDMVNRLTMALIVVGLFIGSSIVYYAGMKPIIFGIPVVGFMGYVIAFILSVWIVFDIYFKGRKKKH
ncbi:MULTISPECIES: ABC1 kinase family protein [unclassified Bifidobacterium]|uniref:ABC1 kinase family protein n=1 Tax=unclassified Bifidobacterium TaxID=2608897 RepID=UPI003F939141